MIVFQNSKIELLNSSMTKEVKNKLQCINFYKSFQFQCFDVKIILNLYFRKEKNNFIAHENIQKFLSVKLKYFVRDV